MGRQSREGDSLGRRVTSGRAFDAPEVHQLYSPSQTATDATGRTPPLLLADATTPRHAFRLRLRFEITYSIDGPGYVGHR